VADHFILFAFRRFFHFRIPIPCTAIWFVFTYLVSILIFAGICSLFIHGPKTSRDNVTEYAECESAAHERQKAEQHSEGA
jgi:hypothetical protein